MRKLTEMHKYVERGEIAMRHEMRHEKVKRGERSENV